MGIINKILNFSLLVSVLLSSEAYSGLNPNQLKSEPSIRVNLYQNKKKVNISGVDLTRTFNLTKNRKSYNGRKKLRYNCSEVKLSDEFSRRPVVNLANIYSKTGVIKLDKEIYYGSLNLIKSKNQKSCSIINQLPLERYISQVLPKEMSNTWPVEALKAQAVAARTYALYKVLGKSLKKKNGYDVFYDLLNSEKFQVSGSILDENKTTQKATKQTRGEVLIDREGNIQHAFFHSKCGGRTYLPEQVWSNPVNSYQRVDCPHCYNHGVSSWSFSMNEKQMSSFLKKYLISNEFNKKRYLLNLLSKSKSLKIRLVKDYKDNAYIRIYLNEELIIFKKSLFRRFLGRKKIPSNNFTLEKAGKKFKLFGDGKGHGVGMCQFGALQMARSGSSYKQILKFYFPNFKLKKIY